MDDRQSITVWDMVRTLPGESSLLFLVPGVVIPMLLGNSLRNGMPLVVTVTFSLVMLGTVWLLLQYRFIQFRREALEHRYLDSPMQ